MKTLSEKQLIRQRDTAAALLVDIERSRRQKEQAELVGKCFKFYNSYGSGDGWWLYTKVTKVGKWWPECFQFQHRSDNHFDVKERQAFTGAHGGYQEISSAEFDSALVEFKSKLLLSLEAPTTI